MIFHHITFLLATNLLTFIKLPSCCGFHELQVQVHQSREKNGRWMTITPSGGGEVASWAFFSSHMRSPTLFLRDVNWAALGSKCNVKGTGLYLVKR